MVFNGSVFKTLHSWLWLQTFFCKQGFSHFELIQVKSFLQSESLLHSTEMTAVSTCLHSKYGFPLNPAKQVQIGWWFLPTQVAFWAQVLSSHTGRQTRLSLSQDSWSAQSSLYWQSTEIHEISGFPCMPCGQTHWALWSWTLHSALRPQLTVVRHGSRHFSLIQALSNGHSLSDLHCAEKKRKFS